jgi:hypothetical protein
MLYAVSLRSDADNPAVVAHPNPVKGLKPARGTMMCSLSGEPALVDPTRVPFSPMDSLRLLEAWGAGLCYL